MVHVERKGGKTAVRQAMKLPKTSMLFRPDWNTAQ